MDSIFNSPDNITNYGVGMFIQDDYAELGLGRNRAETGSLYTTKSGLIN